VPYRHDRNDLEALAAAAYRFQARLVYLANPGNPSGTWHSARDLRTFVDGLPSDCLVLLDEAYVDFAPPDAIPAIDATDPRVLHLRTFSKAHGMAGARIGYAIGPGTIMAAFDKIRLHYGVNLIAQEGALASLADPPGPTTRLPHGVQRRHQVGLRRMTRPRRLACTGKVSRRLGPVLLPPRRNRLGSSVAGVRERCRCSFIGDRYGDARWIL
jgi:histidinol-phosphate/aromatic aminotransferase/cobyric acid decarboxylase-like protein